MISEARWLECLTFCGVRAETAFRWAPLFTRYVQPENFSLGLREIDDYVGQVLHETARLEKLVESLNYSAQRLTEVWPDRFPTLEKAISCAWNPQGLAERTYGNRLGNHRQGDGWKYRGRGIPMVTGLDNYKLLQALTGEPLVDKPELLEQPDVALQCSIHWWEKRVPDSAIDTIERVTKAVQGGKLALREREEFTKKAGAVLAVHD
ncbi:glycoside hydrolase family 19 protein [Methylibium petroleiphilum]